MIDEEESIPAVPLVNIDGEPANRMIDLDSQVHVNFPDTEAGEPTEGPLSWVNSASIILDENEDSVTYSISVGDPRGGFTFTIRRIPDDADNDIAGRLVMHVPHLDEPQPHADLTRLYDGTYLIG